MQDSNKLWYRWFEPVPRWELYKLLPQSRNRKVEQLLEEGISSYSKLPEFESL